MKSGNKIKQINKDRGINKKLTEIDIIWRWVFFGIVTSFVFLQLVGINIDANRTTKIVTVSSDISLLREEVLPSRGAVLPIQWGSLGKQMIENGVIDADAFEGIYKIRGGLSREEKSLLYGERNGNLEINAENSSVVLNLLWAFGLSNKNPILEEGPMQDPRYGGIEYFASTGGWTLARGNIQDHYSKHTFVTLTAEQQALVESVSKNIYRPCCNNPAYFPDCNHGMAMLGLLELMASGGANETEMYETALQVNSYWFPDTYITLARYFAGRGVSWDEVEPKVVLSSAYSGASGFNIILAEVEPLPGESGPSCGV